MPQNYFRCRNCQGPLFCYIAQEEWKLIIIILAPHMDKTKQKRIWGKQQKARIRTFVGRHSSRFNTFLILHVGALISTVSESLVHQPVAFIHLTQPCFATIYLHLDKSTMNSLLMSREVWFPVSFIITHVTTVSMSPLSCVTSEVM